jgi:hypothetical protein
MDLNFFDEEMIRMRSRHFIGKSSLLANYTQLHSNNESLWKPLKVLSLALNLALLKTLSGHLSVLEDKVERRRPV